MHMLLVITGGLLLCGVFALFGKLWDGDMTGVVTGLKLFVPVWLVVAFINMWVGVTKAGYTFAQELPILLVVFAVPAVIAAVLAWQGRGLIVDWSSPVRGAAPNVNPPSIRQRGHRRICGPRRNRPAVSEATCTRS
ncbi:hypothetical protein M2281_001337 [Mesorhizobium soli]|uniref:hypothetical protein n=1 Tax=Pseudaminobacter soli (ex Li et al. 2025) TaxID=1295366 RepID=UPI002473AF5A|nr:hypothetical protein [Mesorhizobium soli]MDH6230765.1 hypothetical protein [Mesorhizobium soli]